MVCPRDYSESANQKYLAHYSHGTSSSLEFVHTVQYTSHKGTISQIESGDCTRRGPRCQKQKGGSDDKCWSQDQLLIINALIDDSASITGRPELTRASKKTWQLENKSRVDQEDGQQSFRLIKNSPRSNAASNASLILTRDLKLTEIKTVYLCMSVWFSTS